MGGVIIYTDEVMNHFITPRNAGVLPNADGIGNAGSPACGDEMRLYIKVENGVIIQTKFQTFGCASAIASSSVTTEMLKGKTIREALQITNKDVIDALGGLPKEKIHCSVLAEGTIKAAIKDYANKKNIDFKELQEINWEKYK